MVERVYGDQNFRFSQINALAVTQPIVSLVCTSFSGTSNLSGAFNWHEQVI